MNDSDIRARPAGSPVFGIHAEALALRQERLRLIASNLANADTPHYLAHDLDFSTALRQAVDRADTSAASGTPGESAPLAAIEDLVQRNRVYRVPSQPSLDGNTVDTHEENAAFARASLEYRASLGFLEDRIRTLTTAITGQ